MTRNHDWLAWPGALVFIGGLGVLGWESFTWLRYGVWPGYDVSWFFVQMGWPKPDFEWVGIAKIVNWLFSWSLWLTGVALGVFLFIGGAVVSVLLPLNTGPEKLDSSTPRHLEAKFGRKIDLP